MRPLRVTATAAYAAGSFGTGVFSTVPAILLLYFCTEILHINAAWAAALVFVPKLWAIVWDPMVGVWSDRAVTPLGRRRPFLIIGACGVAVAFVGVFSPPNLSLPATTWWMGLSYFALATVYSLYAVPYVSIPSEMPDEQSRARLVAWRMLVAMIGVLTGAGLVPQIVGAAGGGRRGYQCMSFVIACACAIAMLMPLFMLQGRDLTRADRAPGDSSTLRQVGTVLCNHSFRCLVASYVLQLTAVGIISATAPYLVTGAFQRPEGDVGIAMVGMLGATTLSMPIWAWTARRLGIVRVLVVAVLLFGSGSIAIGALALSGSSWLACRCAYAFTGVAFAGLQVLPYTLVAHLIHHAVIDGRAGESSFTGVWTAAEKLGLAFGPAFTGITLAVWQAEKIGAVSLLVIFLPGALGLLSLPLLTASTARPGLGVAGT
jgi:GPH family glycoside/pentoside/hexuronide:cation symporter